MFVVLTVCLVLGHTGRLFSGRLLCFRGMRLDGVPKETLASLAEPVFDGSLPVGVSSAED